MLGLLGLLPGRGGTVLAEQAGKQEFDGENMYMGMNDNAQEFLSANQTYNSQNENNEDYEIPPITPPNLPDPSLLHLVDHETGYHSLCHSLPPNSLIPAYPYQNMDLPAIMVSNMLSQDGHLLSSQLPTIQEMVHSDAASYDSNRQVPLLNRPGMLAGPMSALSQSQLISQMGMRSGVAHGSPSPPGSKSATPSPSSSTQEEETESHYKATGEKRPSTDLGKKPKSQKKKKKKDPNEPQKPVSAYALFFRDTQAAIKGQNPNATFGDVSKIVASMWDSLGEEQKQAYKRKTEAAKKEYLKALAAYRASLVSKGTSQLTLLYASREGPWAFAACGFGVAPVELVGLLAQGSTLDAPVTLPFLSTLQDFSHISSEFQNSVGPRSPGASNPPGSTEWDNDYPSRECGVNHCSMLPRDKALYLT
ncbi:TOX high mobility group box family member 2 [Manacus vitellinus]|uniref:TOX high mobility group box family member 2 n=1 Tax=Manacus vitellinus TaxID=328815 RepID=UPI00115D50A6|nr:TOX high mobility group box family member 2 [Manacus vitellinus]